MIPVEITSLQKNMFEVTQFNVLEPVGGDPVLLKDIDLILVPGLGFTNDGNRLGRGRGIYDRFLSQPDMRAITCGLAMELQVLETLPVLDHDAPLSMLVTNRNVRRFSRK